MASCCLLCVFDDERVLAPGRRCLDCDECVPKGIVLSCEMVGAPLPPSRALAAGGAIGSGRKAVFWLLSVEVAALRDNRGFGKSSQHRGQIIEAFCDHMNHAGFVLQLAGD